MLIGFVIAYLVVTIAIGLWAAAFGTLAQTPGSIVVYNAQHASLVEAWAEGFTKETGIKVIMRRGGDMEMANHSRLVILPALAVLLIHAAPAPIAKRV